MQSRFTELTEREQNTYDDWIRRTLDDCTYHSRVIDELTENDRTIIKETVKFYHIRPVTCYLTDHLELTGVASYITNEDQVVRLLTIIPITGSRENLCEYILNNKPEIILSYNTLEKMSPEFNGRTPPITKDKDRLLALWESGKTLSHAPASASESTMPESMPDRTTQAPAKSTWFDRFRSWGINGGKNDAPSTKAPSYK